MPSDVRRTPPARRWSATEGGAQLAGKLIDGAAGAAGELLAPLPFGLEAAVADRLAPGRDHLADGVGVGGVAAVRLDRGDDVGDDAQKRAQRHAGADAVLATVPRLVEDALDLLEVVQEEAFRVV